MSKIKEAIMELEELGLPLTNESLNKLNKIRERIKDEKEKNTSQTQTDIQDRSTSTDQTIS